VAVATAGGGVVAAVALDAAIHSRLFTDAKVASHAASGCRKRHVIAVIRVRMTPLALDPCSRVRFVAKWKRLRGAFDGAVCCAKAEQAANKNKNAVFLNANTLSQALEHEQFFHGAIRLINGLIGEGRGAGI